MLRNYLKIAFRNLLKHKLFSVTNLLGLTIGVLCCLMILMYVNHEMGFDRWNPKVDRLVRPYADINFGGAVMNLAVTGAPIAPEAAASLPEIENWCRLRNYGSSLARIDGTDQMNIEVDPLHADSTFFDLFPISVIEGNARTCLTEPNTAVISTALADKLFGASTDIVGKTLLLDNREKWRVTGIYENIPSNTHFEADALLSLVANQEIANSPPFWAANNNFHTYLLLREGVDRQDFAQKFETLSREKVELTSSQLLGMTLEEFEATGQYARYGLQDVSDIHLKSDLYAELQPNGNIKYIWIFLSIALFVLLIACINFMNLTTAKSTQRSEEIAVRKVLGSSRKQLISQFLSEAYVMTFLAVVLAVLSSLLLLPWFNDLTGRDLALPWSSGRFWLGLLGGILVVGLVAGSYPALFLSAFKPIQVLKDRVGKLGGHSRLRSGLVVGQFLIAMVLIISTLLIYQQLKYIQNKQLGFQKEQVIVVNDAFSLGSNIAAYKQRMLQHAAVESATISSYLPIPSSRSNTTYSKIRELRQDQAINMASWQVDHDYLSTLNLELTEGRFFDRDFVSDSTAVVLNEAAVAVLGFDNPVGEKIYGLTENLQGAPTPEAFVEYTIVGVVKDFHFESLRENIGSLGLFLGESRGLISLRYQAGASGDVIGELEATWQEMAPNQPFSYRFVDESFEQMYEAEQRVGHIAIVFTILAIIVSCLGLFGLSTFVVEQRTKEIGIRKVLGASVAGIVGLLSKGFMTLVLTAFLLAIPITWYFMNDWLSNFAYRVDIHWSIFALAGVLAAVIAFATISFQSIRAAVANPVDALRSE